MDGPPDLEERRLRAARRFGRIGLAITVVWLLLVPAYVLGLGGMPPAGIAVPLLGLYLVGFGLHVWRIREHVRSLGRPASARFAVLAAAVGLGITFLGLAAPFPGVMWALVAGVLLGDVVSGLRGRWVAVWVLGAGAVTLVGGYAVAASVGPAVPPPIASAGFATFFVVSMWCLDVERLWWLKAVTDLDDSRRTAAELARARERLRLADDLHDILGHALEVVAFKSELAGRLLEVDAERARDEMEEVQRVARSSMTEVRSLVRDRRPTDLADELAGARAVLGSAGVALTVRGDVDAVREPARDVLGRVLREAMTNVLRHAEPSRCTIAVEAGAGGAVLRVENDGALPGDGDGTGLTALARYLDEHSGRLEAAAGPDGTFRLTAVLPGAVP